METAFPKVTSTKVGLPARDFFTWRYLAAWTIFYVSFGAINIVFDHYWYWTDILAILAAILTLTWGVFWFFRNHNRRALSVLLVLPFLWCCDFALTAVGVDTVQRSFWLTYPYYIVQIESDKAKSFQWAENGYLFGGRWQYTLMYDPASTTWDRFKSDYGEERKFVIGTLNKAQYDSSSSECERRQIRQLGGNWYFKSFESGVGLC